MSRVLTSACVALGTEQARGAGQCLQMSAALRRTRCQFGRHGSFQAVTPKCADMLVRVEVVEARPARRPTPGR